jgi:hypothetical protein
MSAPVLVSKAYRDRLYAIISSGPFFADHFKAIRQFAPHPSDPSVSNDTPTPSYILEWARNTLRTRFEACAETTLGIADGPAMVDFVQYFDEPFDFLSEVYVSASPGPQIKDCAANMMYSVAPKVGKSRDKVPAFYLAFLAHLRLRSEQRILPMEASMQLCWTETESFISALDLAQICGHEFSGPHAGNREAGEATNYRTAVSCRALGQFLARIVEAEAGREAGDLSVLLTSKIADKAGQIPPKQFPAVWLPFLRHTVLMLTSVAIPLDTPCWRDMFAQVLLKYVEKYVGHEPEQDESLARPSVDCDCRDCVSLSIFLNDSTRRVGEFSIGKQRRGHLHRQLQSANADCTHETFRGGNPQTLVITKTFLQNERMRSNWKLRRVQAEKEFDMFDKSQLSLLLGSEYMTIVGMAHLSAGQRASAPAPVQTSTAATPSLATNQRQPFQEAGSPAQRLPGVGGKRKFPFAENEVVDLTSD